MGPRQPPSALPRNNAHPIPPALPWVGTNEYTTGALETSSANEEGLGCSVGKSLAAQILDQLLKLNAPCREPTLLFIASLWSPLPFGWGTPWCAAENKPLGTSVLVGRSEQLLSLWGLIRRGCVVPVQPPLATVLHAHHKTATPTHHSQKG